MGEVYRATDTRLGRDVAIKVLSPELASDRKLVSRFEQEARAASALNHPSITTIHDIGEADSIFYIAMELIDGKTLRDILTSGALPTRRLLQISAQIAEGLAKAHDAGIVHRDLKPENIMVTADGRAKILDFGIAKLAQPLLDADGAKTMTGGSRTEPGIILGTVGYMSPEQASARSVGIESDQFSLGAIVYEMATGHRAFKRATAIETLNAVIREEPSRIETLNTNVPLPLRWILARCLSKDPEQRYASTRDLARDLQNLQEHQLEAESVGSTTIPAERIARTSRLRLLALVAMGIAVIASLIGGFVLGQRNRRPLPEFRQLTFRHGHIRGARLAPDGRTVVYGASWLGVPPETYVIRPESPQSGSLGLGNAGVFSVSAGGEIAVALGCRLNWGECIGTLAQVPLGGGAPREILKDVHGADWSPDGRALAAIAVSGAAYRLHYPIGKVLYEAPAWITYVRVSPNGDRVAFLDHPTLGDIGGSVCFVDASGKKTILSSGWKALQGLAWSPSGDEIWFTGSRVSKGGALAMHAVTLSGRERQIFSAAGTLKLFDISRDGERVLLMRGTPRASIVTLASGAVQERELSWFDYSAVADISADGKTLLFYEWGEGVGGTLTAFLRKTDGSDAIRLGEGRPLALSPDGRWAVVVQQTTPPELLLLPTGPGEIRRLPRGAMIEYLDWAAWSPDGRRVFFAGQESTGIRGTYVQDIGGGDPRLVTPDGLVATLLSPDGKFVAAIDRYGEYYLCPVAEACEPRAIEGYLDGDVLIQWSADARFLFVREAGNLALRLYRLDLSNGRREFWKELTPADPAALVDIGSDPGQVRLTPDGRSYAYTYRAFAGELYLVQGLE